MIRINAKLEGSKTQAFLERFSQVILEKDLDVKAIIDGDMTSPSITLLCEDPGGAVFDCLRRYIGDAR